MFLVTADKARCDEFFAMLARLEGAYVHIALNYIAIKNGTDFQIMYGRVYLNTADPNWQQRPHFQSENVRAGHYLLSDLKLDLRSFIDQLVSGLVETPDGPLMFPAAEGGSHATSYVPFHDDGLRQQTRFSVLTIMGGQIAKFRQPDLDWEIKAASLPYDGLQEIANDLGLGLMNNPTASVEIVAFNVAAIDLQASRVIGTSANLQILLAKHLTKSKVVLGYRVFAPGVSVLRAVVPGDEFEWSENGPNFAGRTKIEVPAAAVVNCVVSYNSLAQSHQWIGDPERTQNSRRAVYETFDSKLESLKAAIANASLRGQDARQLEHAVAWLLWLLGFSVAHLGGMPRIRDAADIIASTPAGHFAIVECTTGLLKAENKLALLHARTTAARANLAASNSSHLRVLPVIVTSRTTAEIQAEVEAAERLGVLVIARENLDQAIDRTLIQPNADQAYLEAEQAVAAALAKYNSEPNLPF
jgi:hypothetical protein